ncbi:hypothetical protein BRD03_11655 [Halobacteriales archaeon QS_9_68_17]|nr:MAG: hypothetical protein BRD03_11655 [Halobacteriales archaeon QS_9_68_17]
MKQIAAALTALLVIASVTPAGVAASGPAEQEAEAYSGAHVSFEVENSAMTDYAVDGDVVAETVAVESQSDHESRTGVDAGADVELSTVTGVAGAETSLAAQSSTRASVDIGGSAEMTAHDSEHGVLIVDAGGESQYVEVGLASDAEAEQESDSRVAVTTANGSETAFVVVGEGEVTTNEDGNVTASLGDDAKLVTRSYDERGEDDERTEAFIANGTATAEVYLTERDGEAVADTIEYGQDTAVEVTERSESEVRMTAERATEEGTVVIASVSDAALAASDSLTVTIDGEAAAEASSYAELRNAAEGGNSSAYAVRQSGSAEASADVLVAVNHFSEREIVVADDGASEETTTEGGDDESDGETSDGGGQPGFGVTAALAALLSLAAARIRG